MEVLPPGLPRGAGAPDLDQVRRILAGDAAAFSELVKAQQGILLRLARGYVRTPASAEEVVQETWLAVLEGLSKFEGRSSLRTWITHILMNKARTRATREGRSIPMSSLVSEEEAGSGLDESRFTPGGSWSSPPTSWGSQDTPEGLLLNAETRTHLESAIDELPPVQRSVLTMRDLGGMSAEEVCNVLELSETNQRVLLHRARTRVRAYLEEHLGKRP